MKKVQKYLVLLVSIAILVLGTLLIQSCEKDPINPPPPPETFTMTSIVNGKGLVTPDKLSGIKAGSNLLIKFLPDSSYSLHTVKINGNLVQEIPESEIEFSYSYNNIYSNFFMEANFVKTDILWFSVESLNEKPWMLEGVDVYHETGKFIESVPLEEEEKTDKLYFLYPSMELVFIRQNGSVTTGKWDLKDKIIQFGSTYFPIVELTKTKMSYKSGPLPGGSYGVIYTVSVYKR